MGTAQNGLPMRERDAVKIGVGPGSICTTRIIAGIGMPQFTAVVSAVEACDRLNIPVIADGRNKIFRRYCQGSGCRCCRCYDRQSLCGPEEAPGREIIYEGRIFKYYRGMGSIGAIQAGGGSRYRMEQGEEPVPEGIEGRVPFKGELAPYLHQLATGIRKGWVILAARTLNHSAATAVSSA